MNKLLIVLLAICLVSVHAFVKRDAETAQPDALKEFGDKVLNTVKEAVDPENIKKGFNDLVDKVQGAIDQFNAKPKEAKE
ncbi:uncharacterized protein LOC124535258 [Vanessa cardui]|uniref:uncharacterized protein LOC124535258 n=1 Tax=Vanessa cardui TaxID=171605 RepID=UPI001F140113|nr:uncharacterized protein LOC124535258 [Vanessa cardui]